MTALIIAIAVIVISSFSQHGLRAIRAESDGRGSNPTFATNSLSNPGHFTSPLCASVPSLFCEMEIMNVHTSQAAGEDEGLGPMSGSQPVSA